MDDTYKGDSPGKKLARAAFWTRVVARRRPATLAPKFLVLPGREGGDIATLKAIGAEESSVFGAERSRSAFESVTSNFPDARIHYGDLRELTAQRDVRQSVDFTLLDFCSPLSDELVSLFCETAARCAKHRSIVAVGFMYGREREQRDFLREQRDKWAHIYHGLPGALNALDAFDSSATADAREIAARAAIKWRSELAGIGLVFVGRVRYHSRTTDKQGVPMIYLAFECIRNAGTRPKAINRTVEREEAANPLGVWRLSYADGDLYSELKQYAVRDARAVGAEKTAGLLGIPRATIAAWLAHDTRGTYERMAG